MEVTYRPLGLEWPTGKRTSWGARQRSRFKKTWSGTMYLLDREIRHLGGRRVVFQIDLRESDIRNDGLPRANARPGDPAVIISFESKFGPLRYSCDLFTEWQDNIRAIALGLQALRTVDRYGITKRGEQYAGWKALPQGSGANENVVMNFANARDAAAWILEKAAKDGLGATGAKAVEIMFADKEYRDNKFRQAAMKLHPDQGGNESDWHTLTEARRLVESESG